MHIKVSLRTVYHCSLERAFKTAILCDVTKIHTGYGLMPRVSHTTEDEDWGQPGSSKNIHMVKSFFQGGGFTSVDRILERKENEYWIIQVDSFQYWFLSFYKFIGEWRTSPLEGSRIQVDYNYELHTRNIFLYPLCWFFGKIYWKRYMRQILENIRQMISDREAYQFE